MKIAIVCFNLSWQAGGVRLIYEEAQALKRLGHEVVIYAPDFDERVYPELRNGLDVRNVPPAKPVEWQYTSNNLLIRIVEKLMQGRRIAGIARQLAEAMDDDFDFVNVHDFAYKTAKFYRKRNKRAKIVWYIADFPYMYLPKDNFFYDTLSRLYNYCKDLSERRYFRYVDSARTLVNRNLLWLRERGVKAEIIWTGIDFAGFYAPPKKIEGKKNFQLLGVGAINKYRRFEDIVDAAKILRAEGYDIRTVIVCKNIWKEDAYVEELNRFVDERRLSPYTKLMFEGATEKELKEIYAASDFFILPIYLPPPRHGFGWQMVLFEAMAAGVPSIVCRTNDVCEAVKDDETVLLVDPLAPEQIAEKVKCLIDNPTDYYRIASAGQKFVKENMSWEKFAEEMLGMSDKK